MPEKDHASGVKISRGDELQRSQTRPAAVIEYSMPKSSEFRSSIEQVRFSNGRKIVRRYVINERGKNA
jgi:hypothetical protein